MPKTTVARPADRWSLADSLFRGAFHQGLRQLVHGNLVVRDARGERHFGGETPSALQAAVRVHEPAAYRQIAFRGSLGAAEGYLDRLWSCDDLVSLFQILIRNGGALRGFDRIWTRVKSPMRWVTRSLQRNTRTGSKRNIAAHYDLSNEFFGLFLDDTMTYSSGLFGNARATLFEASIAKYERVCRKLQLTRSDHVLEIGTGWGGFAIYAAANYGCRVTTTTISAQQYAYARRKVAELRLDDRVTVLKQDYRDLTGNYDKIASIEMIEAVGHEFLNSFFQKCSSLLKPDGLLALQVITIPDHDCQRYRNTTDFIRQYIFPGGCLPSVSSMTRAAATTRELRMVALNDFALHYARTIAIWRQRFFENIESVRDLGFDEPFIRMWEYYLCYCEAGFREQKIGLAQTVFQKTGVYHSSGR